ncbi:class E sortase [Actinomadura craniellae]|nr:class E sortase [Actinomadura craniellae]
MRSVRLALAALLVVALSVPPAAPTAAAPAAVPAAAPKKKKKKTTTVTVHIPRFGRKYRHRVVKGVSQRALTRGIGHYPGTAPPGAIGNMVLAGHRTMHPAPFANIHLLRKGDRIIVKARGRQYVYRVFSLRIVPESNKKIAEPVPFRPGKVPTQRIATLFSCHPKGSRTKRYVAFARMA